MARKSKKKRRAKGPKPKLTSVQDVVAKAVTSKKLMRLWQDALLRDEVIDLKQRLQKAQEERESMRRRAAEREDQHEAVFDTLKQRVAVAQAEIQTLVIKMKENDKRRRREHDDTQRTLQERLDEVKFHRAEMASLQAVIQDKERALGRFTSELRKMVMKNDELLKRQERLDCVEQLLDSFRRKLVVLERVEAGEQMRVAVANDRARQGEEGGTTCGAGKFPRERRVPPAGDALGVGLVPLLMEAMAQYPEDVKLTRDALVLLGHVASTEHLGQTFLTTHSLYHEVVMVLQRNVTDGIVALHAARLLHKCALQGEATARDLRAAGVIPLLAEALAAASYGPSGARKPRRLLYHAFATMQLCYPNDFYDKSLQALGLPQGTDNPKRHNSTSSPFRHCSTLSYEETTADNAATPPLASAAADTTAAESDPLGALDSTIPRRKSGVLGKSKPTGGNTRRSNPQSKSPLRRRRGRYEEAAARAPRLQPLRSAARGQPLSVVCGEENSDTRRGAGKALALKRRFTAQRRSSKAGCLTEVGDGNSSYWGIMGRTAGGDDRHNGDVGAGVEQSKSAVASVVLLRWAMECSAGNEGGGVVDGVSHGGHRFGSFTGIGTAGSASSVRGISTVPGKAMNATISGPVHLMRAERKPRDSDLFVFSDPLESGAKRGGIDASDSPRRTAPASSLAATSPAPLVTSRCGSLERPEEVGRSLLREQRGAVGGGRERRPPPPEDSHRDSFGDDVSTTRSPSRQETKYEASGDEGPGGRHTWVAGRSTRSRGEVMDDARRTKRWLAPSAQDIASYALVCLLRAAEVDVCGHTEVDCLDTGGRVMDTDTAGGGKAIVMEEGVLLLILRACAMFQNHDGVVKACCMLMRVSVQCSLSGGAPKQPVGGLNAMVPLVKHGVEDVVTRAAQMHVDNEPVITEARRDG
eukprot:g6510.t1